MVKFGYHPDSGSSDPMVGQSVVTQFMRDQSASPSAMRPSVLGGTAQYKRAPSVGGGGSNLVSTPEEMAEKRPYAALGKSSLSLYGQGPVAYAPSAPDPGNPALPTPQETGAIANKGIDLLDWGQMMGIAAEIFSPMGKNPAKQGYLESEVWNNSLNSEDPLIRSLSQEWHQRALSSDVDGHRFMSEFYDQYNRIVARREGRSSLLADSFSTNGVARATDPGSFLGAVAGEMFKPLNVLATGVQRSLSGDIGPEFNIGGMKFRLHEDRVRETLREYDADATHGRLTEGLVAYTEAYKRGDVTDEEFRDLLVLEGFALTNPEPMGKGNWLLNIPVSFALEVFTDPITYVTLGAGVAAKVGVTSAKVLMPAVGRAAGRMAVVDAAKAAGVDAIEFASTRGAEALAESTSKRVIGELTEIGAQRGAQYAGRATAGEITETLFNLVDDPVYGRAITEAFEQHKTLAMIGAKAPSIVRIGRAVDAAFDPLTIVAKTGGAARARIALSRIYSEGFINGLGWTTVRDANVLMARAGLPQEVWETLQGRAAANHALQVGNATNLRRMRASGGSWVPDDPRSAARDAAEMMGMDVRGAMERQVDSTSEFIVPRVGDRGGVAGLKAWQDEAATMLTRMGAKGDIAGATAKMSEQHIRYIRHLYWAHMLGEVEAAKSAARGIKGFGSDLIERVTMLGARQMSEAHRLQLLQDIADGKIDAVRAGVERFDDLRVNLSLDIEDAELLKGAKELLDALAGKVPGALKDDGTLPPALAQFLKDNPLYSLGLRPADDDLAALIKNADGEVIGVRSWVEPVMDSVKVHRVNAGMAIARDLTRGIAGDAIARSAKRRFIAHMAQAIGMSERDSKAILREVDKIAQENGITQRGLSKGDMQRAVRQAKGVDPKMLNKGERAIVDGILSAYEGELRLVGLTQKTTGRAKTILGPIGNFTGIMAENFYPKVRFLWSPVFIAMEKMELPFFLVLRGQYPMRGTVAKMTRGLAFGEHLASRETYDEQTKFLMGYLRNENGYAAADAIEMNSHVRLAYQVAERIANRKTKIGGWSDSLLTAVGNFFNIRESKEMGERLVYRNRMGAEMAKALLEESPATYWAARSAYPAEMNDGEFITSWLYDMIARSDPESVWTKTSPTLFQPKHLGRTARFSPSLVAHVVMGDQHMTLDALRKAAKDPLDALNPSSIRASLEAVGADPNYIDRAIWMVTGPDEVEFERMLVDNGLDPDQASAFMKSSQIDAERMGLGLNELLGRRWADAPQSVDQFGDQKGTYAFQLIVDSLESRGLIAPERGSPLLQSLADQGESLVVRWDDYGNIRIGKRAEGELGPGAPDYESQAAYERAEPAAAKARQKYVDWTSAREQRAFDPKIGRPPTMANGDPVMSNAIHTYGEVTVDKWLQQLEHAIPDEARRREYADWYTDMQRGFLAMFSHMPEEQQVQEAAKMIVAFGVTQLNTSPALGMEFLYRVLSMARRGEDWPSVLGLTEAEGKRVRQSTGGLNFSQLEQILMERGGGTAVPEQLGQKLADFIDSLIGKKTRSVGIDGPNPGRPWQPVAGDIWAKRDLGYVDAKIGKEVWRTVEGGRSSKTIGTYKRDAAGKVIIKDGEAVWDKVDRIEVYGDQGEVIFTIPKEHIGQGAPTDVEYDYIVEFYNKVADHLNQLNYLERTWTAADAQAMGWFRAKLAFGDTTGDVRSAIYKGRWTAASEINPMSREYAPPPVVPGPTESWMSAAFRTQMDENVRWGGIDPDTIPFHDGEPNTVQHFDSTGDYFADEAQSDIAHRVYVYYDDSGTAAGFALVAGGEDGKAYAVSMVSVRQDARRQGIASAMYNQAEQDGLEISKVTGKHGLLPDGEMFSPAYVDRVIPYRELLPSMEDLSHDVVRNLNDGLTLRAHDAAAQDAGVLTPRARGIRFWDGRPVQINPVTGHYTTTLEGSERYSRGRIVDVGEKNDIRIHGQSLLDRDFKREPLAYADGQTDELITRLEQSVTPYRDSNGIMQNEWGGDSVDLRTGGAIRGPEGASIHTTGAADTLELPIDATPEELRVGVLRFIDENRELLEKEDHFLGIFRDKDKGTIDLDVARAVYSEEDAEAIQTALDRKGGAYSFDTGNGVYPAITRDEIGTGKNTTSGFGLNANGEVVERHGIEVLGDRTAATQYAHRLGLYAQQDEVLLVRDTNVKALDYDNAKGDGNIGGMVRIPVRSPEEGEALLRAIAEGKVPAFPKGAHTAQSDDGSWIVQAMWDPAGGKSDGGAFKRGVKGVDAQVSEALGRRIDPELTPVEFIRVKNDWAKARNGEEYLDGIAAPSGRVEKFGREFPTQPSATAGELERERVRALVARAETDIQQTIPREAAAHRTSRLYDGPLADDGTGRVIDLDERLSSPTDGPQYQRAPTGTRAAIVRADNGRDVLFLGGRRVRVDTLLHEVGHKIAFDLDPSAIRRIKGIKAGLEGTRPGTAAGRFAHRLTEDEHEWFTHQFLLWVKHPDSVHVTLHPLMEVFRRDLSERVGREITREGVAPLAKRVAKAQRALDKAIADGKPPAFVTGKRAALRDAKRAERAARGADAGLDPEMRQLFDDLAEAGKRKEKPAYWDTDEENAFAWAQRSNIRATRDAKTTVHFRSERSVMERSMNHPFIGLYPLSYMYGKVLPELIEFLMFRPFGMKSPLLAMAQTNRMYQSFMRQQEHDEELRTYLYQHEPAMRLMSMFVPGLPWDIPVNMALPMRRLLEAHLTNAQRIDEGKEPLPIDVPKIIGDVIGYQVGPMRAGITAGQLTEGVGDLPGMFGALTQGRIPDDYDLETGGLKDSGTPLAPEESVAGAVPAPPPQQNYDQFLPNDVAVGPASIDMGDIESELTDEVERLEEQLSQYGGA